MGKANSKPLATSAALTDYLLGIQDGLVKQFPGALWLQTGRRVVYASRLTGLVAGDHSNAVGVANTAILQAELDGGGVHLVHDLADVAFDNLLLDSDTTLEFLGGGSLWRIGAPNSGEHCIANRNQLAYPAAPIDHSIRIRGLVLNGNRVGYGSGNDGSVPAFSDPLSRAIVNLQGYGVMGVAMLGVRDLLLEDCTVTDSPAYGFYFGNVTGASFVIRCGKWRRAGDAQTSDDCFHWRGGCDGMVLIGCFGTALDDALGICGNDGEDAPGAITGPRPGTVASGPITNLTILGSRFPGVRQVARFLSANRAAAPITNVVIDGVIATLGVGGDPGYAGALCDDFGLTGPATDGTHGWLDGIRLRNWALAGTQTGPDPGSAGVHIDRCKFGRVEVENVRSRTLSTGQPSGLSTPVVYASAAAVGDTLKLRGLVNEQLVAGAALFENRGNIRSVDADDCEFDQAVAGATLPLAWTGDPRQSYYPTEMVRVAGPIDRLNVRNPKTAGVAHVVRCVGYVPKTTLIDGVSHWVAKGGAVLRSDTVVPQATLTGLDAAHPLDVPNGSVVQTDGTGWLKAATVRLRDMGFADPAGHILGGHTSENGLAWQLDGLGADKIKLTGTGWMYLGGTFSTNIVHPNGRAMTGHFRNELDFRQMGGVVPGDLAALMAFHDGAGADFDMLAATSGGLSFCHNNNTGAPYVGPVALPAVGVVWRIRMDFTNTSGNNWTMKSYYSTDMGRSWSPLFADAAFTTTRLPFTTVYMLTGGGSGWTPTTGLQLGGLVTADL